MQIDYIRLLRAFLGIAADVQRVHYDYERIILSSPSLPLSDRNPCAGRCEVEKLPVETQSGATVRPRCSVILSNLVMPHRPQCERPVAIRIAMRPLGPRGWRVEREDKLRAA
jgi:hypothetical protein